MNLEFAVGGGLARESRVKPLRSRHAPASGGRLFLLAVSSGIYTQIWLSPTTSCCYAASVHTDSRLSAADRVKYREMILLTVFARIPTVRITLSLPPVTIAAILRQIRHLLKLMKSPARAVVSGAGPCW